MKTTIEPYGTGRNLVPTHHHAEWQSNSRARKAAQARRLTDPLGALGFRRPADRIRSETRARQAIFAVAVSIYFAIVGALYAGRPGHDVPTVANAVTNQAVRTDRSRIVVGEAEQPHVTTRSS